MCCCACQLKRPLSFLGTISPAMSPGIEEADEPDSQGATLPFGLDHLRKAAIQVAKVRIEVFLSPAKVLSRLHKAGYSLGSLHGDNVWMVDGTWSVVAPGGVSLVSLTCVFTFQSKQLLTQGFTPLLSNPNCSPFTADLNCLGLLLVSIGGELTCCYLTF